MDPRRLRAGEWTAALSGVALLASLFLPWYVPERRAAGAPGRLDGGELASSAWDWLAVIDVALALVSAAAVLLAILTAAQSVPAVPIAYSALLTIAGTIGVVLVAVRTIDLPSGAGERGWALWMGLAGALGIVLGAVLAMRDERDRGAPRPPPGGFEVIRAPTAGDLQSPP